MPCRPDSALQQKRNTAQTTHMFVYASPDRETQEKMNPYVDVSIATFSSLPHLTCCSLKCPSQRSGRLGLLHVQIYIYF